MEENLYPIFFQGKNWYEKDCDEVFVCYYHSRYSLDGAMSVYVGDGERIMPNGMWL